MSQTTALTTDELGIRVDGAQSEYAPGDTITGHVFRKTPVESPKSSVTISLHGRSESSFTVQGEEGPTKYQGAWDLIHTADHTQKLFEGPLNIASGADEQVWPFTIVLPSHVDAKCAEGRHESQSFIPLDDPDTEHALPSTVELDDEKLKGFIEYWLRAELETSKGGEGDAQTVEARLPFTIVNPSPEDPNDGCVMEWSGDSFAIKSFRLVPGKETEKLSFSKKMKTKFRLFSTSIPTFHFGVQIEVPDEIHLDGSDHIAFKLGFIPDWENTSESIRGVPQTAKITNIALRISTGTEVLCAGTAEGTRANRESIQDAELGVWGALQELNGSQGKEFLMTPGSGETEPLDIGELVNLRLGPPKKDEAGPLSPSFATYNIRRRHELGWTVSGQVADRNFHTSGRQTVVVKPSGGQSAEADEQGDEAGEEQL